MNLPKIREVSIAVGRAARKMQGELDTYEGCPAAGCGGRRLDTSVLGTLRQEDHGFQICLGYLRKSQT